MATVRRDAGIFRTHGGTHSHGTRFLAGVQMTETSDDFLLVQITGGRFHPTDRVHLAVVLQRIVLGHGDARRRTLVQVVQLEGLVS